MNGWGQAVGAALAWFGEALDGDWRSVEEWRHGSRLPLALFDAAAVRCEMFAGQSLDVLAQGRREELRRVARQLRDELELLLAGLEPQVAMAVTCTWSNANQFGYTLERLAVTLGVDPRDAEQMAEDGWRLLEERVSERREDVPFLALWAQGLDETVLVAAAERKAAAVETVPVHVRVEKEDVRELAGRFGVHEVLLQGAGRDPEFDLRAYVAAGLELRIRQIYHRVGLHDRERVLRQFSEGDGLAVVLVGERMKLELYGGEEA